jgi:hypothetical protein
MRVKNLFETKITQEMEDWFNKRTEEHIELVRVYCQKIWDYDRIRFNALIGQCQNHDASKLIEPERIPYIKLTWQHKFDNYKDYKKPGEDDQKEINEATLHHVRNNKHHPESWDNSDSNLVNKESIDSNKAVRKIVDATKMPEVYIAEMTADWMAMSEELGTSIKEWADKNVNVRWKFTEEQKGLIYELINSVPIRAIQPNVRNIFINKTL